MTIRLARIALFITTIAINVHASALEKRTICMWDPVGNSGPVMNFFADLRAKALAWGLELDFKVYTDEYKAAADFDAKVCDGAHLTAIMSRKYVPFAGTLDAIGGIDSVPSLTTTMATIASPKAQEVMSYGDYEVSATLPVGTMYVFVNNRKIRDIRDFKNKKIAILNEDPQMYSFARLAQGRPVETTLANFADKFKRGEVDVLFMPALAYNAFELYQGLGDTGGVIDLPLYYGLLHTVVRKSAFPDDFGANMRNYMLTRVRELLRMFKDAEQQIPRRYWIPTTADTKEELRDFSKEIRLAMKVEGAFDPNALRLLWKIRCNVNPNRPECEMP